MWTILIPQTTRDMQSGDLRVTIRSACAPEGLMIKVLEQRVAKHPQSEELRKQLDQEQVLQAAKLESDLRGSSACLVLSLHEVVNY